MDFNSNSNDENKNEKKKEFGILVPYIYIKKALIRIWNFLLKGLSIGFKCNNILIFYNYIYSYFLFRNSNNIRE